MVVEKKVHRQQQHFHVTVYITEMWPKKKRLVIKQPKTRPLVFHCIVGAHKDKSMRDSLCVTERREGTDAATILHLSTRALIPAH